MQSEFPHAVTLLDAVARDWPVQFCQDCGVNPAHTKAGAQLIQHDLDPLIEYAGGFYCYECASERAAT